MRRATPAKSESLTTYLGFYPRSPCGERPPRGRSILLNTRVSIHALLAESDLGNVAVVSRTWKFLSTLSLRRATVLSLPFGAVWIGFYPRSPCGERRPNPVRIVVTIIVSIHALLAESDIPSIGTFRSTHSFYPRSPCGERLENTLRQIVDRRVSIHALLAESDQKYEYQPTKSDCFYPRSPCGERPGKVSSVLPGLAFLSTLSLRRATISSGRAETVKTCFYPRSPCGERPPDPETTPSE